MPASPSSPKSDTGPPGVPLDTLLDAAEHAGYVVTLKQAVSARGGPNPTRVDLRRGPLLVKLLIYSWYITLEGKGRAKDDFRIQTTRTHDGPLRSERGRISVGIGWRVQDKLFVAFDAWAKRYTGSSSSVHTKRAFIDEVAQQGSAISGGEYLHDPRCGFDEAHVGDFIRWAHSLAPARRVGLVPVRTTPIDAKHKIITGKIRCDAGDRSLAREGHDHSVRQEATDRGPRVVASDEPRPGRGEDSRRAISLVGGLLVSAGGKRKRPSAEDH